MKLFKKLLAPISFQEPTLAVLNYARRIAEVNKGEITLVHVVPTQEYRLLRSVYRPDESGGADERHAEEVARGLLEELGCTHLDGVPWKVLVPHGSNPAKVVLDVERQIDPDLVLVSKSQARELTARLQGGLVEKLIRSSQCPVMSVSALEQLEAPQAVRDVFAPVAFDEKSLSVTRSARSFAEAQGGKVTLLHVILTEPSFLTLRRGAYGFAPDEPVSLTKAQKTAHERLERIAAEHLKGVPYETTVVIGYDVASAILEEERARKPQIIIMATAGYQGFFQVVLGSVAETVARKALCSVVTIRFV